jgi:hypothetical protein
MSNNKSFDQKRYVIKFASGATITVTGYATDATIYKGVGIIYDAESDTTEPLLELIESLEDGDKKEMLKQKVKDYLADRKKHHIV